MTKKQYTGTTYIGVVGGDLDYGEARDSVMLIAREPGDEPPTPTRATKGYEARQKHINRFLDSKHDFILLLDADMVFARDTLQRLRSHKLPYVTGAYMRRQFDPIMAPVWFDANAAGRWPFMPALDVPPPDSKPVKIGASGWGCVLIHREVIQAVRKLLKGEWEVIEDDMDVWPYDLERVMGAINGLVDLAASDAGLRVIRPALEKYAQILREEIRPLRGAKDVVGSDIRFPFFAKAAGYDLYLDPAVTPGHILHYPLKTTDYEGAGPEYHEAIKKNTRKKVRAGRRELKSALDKITGATL